MTSICCLCMSRPRVCLSHLAHLHLITETETTARQQQKHYVGHAISVHVINLPTHLYCITYWLADNQGTLFLRSDSASSSTATPSTSAITAPALKRFAFLSEKLQQSGSADYRSQSSSSSNCATIHAQIYQYLHELPASLPEKDAITFWRRRQAAYSLIAPLA